LKTDELKSATTSEGTQLAIIGIGCLFPQAEDRTAYWANIMDGVDAISEVPDTHWPVDAYYDQDQKSPDRTYGRRGGFLAPVDFNPMEFNIPPNVLEAIDTSQLLGLVAAGQALKDAGYGPERSFDKSRASVILGVTGTLELVIPLGARLGHPIWRSALKDAGVDDATAQDVVERISDSYVPWQENSFPGLLGNVVAGRISKQFDLGGTNCVVDAACASSLSAMHLAALELNSGKSDIVVTGGIDTFNDIFMYMCFSKTPALSPTGNAKPFDTTADGTILGEGLGIVVLKRLSDAERDGDQIYAVIRGIGSSSDGKGDAIYAPSSAGQKKALKNAYQLAGVTPDSIGLLEAHGTGTKVGDAVEVSALREVYGEAEQPWCCLGSVKSQIGHTKAAAGAAGLIKAALALHHKVIPPTIKVQTPQKEVVAGRTPFYLATEKRPWHTPAGVPRRAAVSAFGFGGSNFHLVLEEYRPAKEKADWDGHTQILAFSGANAAALSSGLDSIPMEGSWSALRDAAAASRAAFDAQAPCRLALVIEHKKTNLASLVKNARAMLAKNAQSPWQTPDGAFFSCGDQPGELGILFPGQGSQYTGMLNDLACRFPQLHRSIAAANEGFHSAKGKLLSDLIYPLSAFDAETAADQQEALRATQVAQPAIGATSLGALRLVESFGVSASAVAGHSYGELTALCAAGRLDEDALHSLSRLRGRLMGEGSGDKGSMLAVAAPLDKVGEVLAQEKLELVIANRNAPSQAVLSGSSAEIQRAKTVFAARGLTCKELPVAAAFHSPLVADAAAPLLAALEKVELKQAQIPVYANTTADVYPADSVAAKALLANQLAKPVEFVAEIEAMYEAGIRTFLEAGPGNRLTGLVQAILGNRPHAALALDSSSGKRSGVADLARVIAQLAVLGYGVRLALWDEGHTPATAKNGKKPALTIPLSGANYMKPRAKKPPVQPAPKVVPIATIAPSTQVAPAYPASQNAAPAPVAAPSQPTGSASFARTAPVAASAVPAGAAPAATQAVPQAALSESLRMTRESMAILQKMQEDTALLHRRYLEGQETAAKTFQTLLDQQQQLIQKAATSVHAGSQPYTTPAAPAASYVASPVQPQATTASAAIPTTATAVTTPAIQTPPLAKATPIAVPAAPKPAAVAPQAAAAPVAPAAQPGQDAEHITQTLLKVISEKTGYPIEMLELDMGMDSDLGIDSIKRVEILSALQDRLPGTPAIGPEHLGTLRTLGEIAAHLSAGAATSVIPQAAAATSAPVSKQAGAEVTETLLAVVSEKTGYPIEMLELDMGMDSDLGIDSIKRVEILSSIQERLPGAPAIGPEHLGTLRTLGEIAAHLSAGAASTTVAAATTVAAVAPVAQINSTQITETLLSVVSEKTGYPIEMLELDMGMDSDLGIDSIKRVEILSTLQERLPGSPAIGPEHLGTLRTLGEIAAHLSAGSASAPASVASPAPAAQTIPATTGVDIAAVLLEVVSEKTGYPVEMLELDMGMDSDLGIDSIKRVEILSTLQERLPGSPAIGPEHLGTLRTLGDIACFLKGPKQPQTASAPAAQTVSAPAPSAEAAKVTPPPIERSSVVPTLLPDTDEDDAVVLSNDGEIWVTDDHSAFSDQLCSILTDHGCTVRKVYAALAHETVPTGKLSGLVICAPEAGTDDQFLKDSFQLLKNASRALVQTAQQEGALCVTVSRLDGSFGFDSEATLQDPLSGGLAGLTKTAAHEWPEVSCKAIDLAEFQTPAEAAEAVAVEMLRRGPVEVGLTPDGRYALNLAALPVAPAPAVPAVNEGEVVVITGGGRGVTAAAAVALAQQYRPFLVLLGRSPEPAEEPEWLSGLSEESEIKRAIMQHAVGKLHPREIEERYRAVTAARELQATLASIAATGAQAIYRAIDIRDQSAMELLLAEVRRAHGPIRGVVHGAGVLADRLITDKSPEQFEQVYSTKVYGLRSLLQATRSDELRFIALFSSSTGRFGRIGQVDYAVANEVLNKVAQAEARRRSECRAVSINWGPWDGGMVTPALKKVFAGEGIGVIDLAEGGAFLAREIAAADAPVEIVALAALNASGGATAPAKPQNLSEAFALTLKVSDYPFLRSHVLDGKAVLPMAVIVEWLAHGALHGNPGFRFHGFNDLRICKGVIFEGNNAFTLNVMAGRAVKRESFHLVPVELCSRGANGHTLLHARAEIVLATKHPEGIRSITEIPSTPYAPENGVIYNNERLFHGPDLHGIEQVDGCSAKGIAASVKGAPAPASWIRQPLRSSWLTDPLVLDSAFQMMILWSFERFGAGSLPCFAGRYRQFQEAFPREGAQVVIRVTAENPHAASADMEFLDRHTGKLIARLEGYECVIDPSLKQAFQRNKLPRPVSVNLGAA